MFSKIKYNTGAEFPYKTLRLESQQLFISRLMSPQERQKIIFVKHNPGSGKTFAALDAAVQYLSLFRLFPESNYNIIIVGFQQRTFWREILSHPDLGYISERDFNYLKSLEKNKHIDEDRYKRFYSYLKNSITNLKFFGYQELYNFIFPDGKAANEDALKLFERCFVICDEIHNVYNSLETNNYGEVLKYIFDWHAELKPPAFMKVILMSATPINNKPSEIVDLLKLLIPKSKFTTADFFSENGKLLPGALSKIGKICEGYFSFYINEDLNFIPDWKFEGEKNSKIDFLRFIVCPISDIHQKMVEKLDSLPLESFGILDGVFPISETDYGYRTYEFESVMSAEEWRKKIGISFMNGTLSGGIFGEKTLGRYSGKYARMIRDLIKNTESDGGKVIIVHEYVNGTGIKMIEQILLANGFIPENGIISDTTLCSRCGKTSAHKNENHVFQPARYVMATGEIDKKILNISINKFNAYENSEGRLIKVLLGSEMIREGMDFTAVQHLWIMHPPASVSAFLQTLGRPVRKNSHLALPPEKRHVKFRIYVSDIHFEFERYARKMQNYKIIREIERVIHQSAIDISIYYDLIKKSFVGPGEIGILPFPRPKKMAEFGYSEVFYRDWEIDEIKKIIKAYFIETPVWTYEDLWAAVRNPKFVHYVDSSLFREENFVLALGDIIYRNERISINSEPRGVAICGKYFILFPLTISTDATIIGYELSKYNGIPYKTATSWINDATSASFFKLNITESLRNMNTNYDEMKNKFYKKYKDADTLAIPKSTETYGMAFHERLIEESIAYIFNILTGIGDRTEYHELYFKMINFYNHIDLVIYAINIPQEYEKFYKNYISGEINTNAFLQPKSKTSTLSSFEMSEIEKFINKKKRRVPSNILPVGHILNRTRFYTLEGWFDGKFQIDVVESIENDVIIGYYEKSENSIEFKFKLRSPSHKIEKKKDLRAIEKGIVCETRQKKDLQEIAKSLDLLPAGTNQEICEMIKQDLLHRELKDRNKYRKGLVSFRTRWCYLPTE